MKHIQSPLMKELPKASCEQAYNDGFRNGFIVGGLIFLLIDTVLFLIYLNFNP